MSKIYHYTKLSTAIEHILPTMSLRTNFLNKMNDPKENQIWAFGGINIDYMNIYPKTYSEKTHIMHQYRLGEDIKSKIQALCFVNSNNSKGYENEMMWAHYAERHSGICLELDYNLFRQENEALNIFKFEDVLYQKTKKPYLNWKINLSKDDNIKSIIENNYSCLFMSKSEYWEKEFEKRLILISDEQKYLNIQKSITAVCCGLFTNPNYYPAINKLISKNQTRLYKLYYEKNNIKRFEI